LAYVPSMASASHEKLTAEEAVTNLVYSSQSDDERDAISI
jgi:hypothetical protein